MPEVASDNPLSDNPSGVSSKVNLSFGSTVTKVGTISSVSSIDCGGVVVETILSEGVGMDVATTAASDCTAVGKSDGDAVEAAGIVVEWSGDNSGAAVAGSEGVGDTKAGSVVDCAEGSGVGADKGAGVGAADDKEVGETEEDFVVVRIEGA